MKFIFTILSFLLIMTSPGFAQDYDIKWGEKVASRGRAYDLLPLGKDGFYSFRQTGSMRLPSYRISKHENFVVTESERIVTKANGSSAVIEGQEVINGELYIFLSDRSGGQMMFFMQEYGKDLKPRDRAIKIAEYSIEKGKSKGYFDVIYSKNKDFFAVIWTLNGKKSNSNSYGYKVFDNDIIEVSKGTYTMPFDGDLSGFTYKYLSNTGDLFLAVSEYEEGEKRGLFQNHVNYKAMHLYHVTPDGVDEYTADLKGRRVESLTMNSDDDGVFSIVGAYGEQDLFGVAGVFNLKLDFFKRKIISESFNKFTQDFITQDWSDRSIEKANKRKARGKGGPQLYDYLMRQTEVMPDGSVIGSMEQYYTITRTTTDARGFTSSTTSYYYNDIIAFKITEDGEFDWVKKIMKNQVSQSDGGPYSSYSRFVDNGQIVFVFNDNVKNYSGNGEFLLSSKGLYPASFSSRRNAVAIVTLDQMDGATNRSTFFNRADVQAIAVPKMFQVDHINKEVLIYTKYGTKERIGVLKLND